MSLSCNTCASKEVAPIVNCSSLGGLAGGSERGTYHAAKHGVLGLTKSAALEYASRGIRINAICPGIIDTPMVAGMLSTQAEEMKELMKDEDPGVARAAQTSLRWVEGGHVDTPAPDR